MRLSNTIMRPAMRGAHMPPRGGYGYVVVSLRLPMGTPEAGRSPLDHGHPMTTYHVEPSTISTWRIAFNAAHPGSPQNGPIMRAFLIIWLKTERFKMRKKRCAGRRHERERGAAQALRKEQNLLVLVEGSITDGNHGYNRKDRSERAPTRVHNRRPECSGWWCFVKFTPSHRGPEAGTFGTSLDTGCIG